MLTHPLWLHSGEIRVSGIVSRPSLWKGIHGTPLIFTDIQQTLTETFTEVGLFFTAISQQGLIADTINLMHNMAVPNTLASGTAQALQGDDDYEEDK